MTQYVIAGQAFSFGPTLDPPADAGTVTWLLRGLDGTPLAGATGAIANAAGAYQVVIPTTAPMNTKGATATENRFLSVNWTSNGATQSLLLPYVLIDWIPLRVQPKDVISIVGMNQTEITESEIDIVSAALYVQEDVGTTVYSAALIAGDLSTTRVNQLVALRAAIELAPSIQLRIAQTQKNDTDSLERYRNLDVDKFIEDLWDFYARVRGDLLVNVLPPVPTLMVTGYHTPDPMVIYPERFPCLIFPEWFPPLLLL